MDNSVNKIVENLSLNESPHSTLKSYLSTSVFMLGDLTKQLDKYKSSVTMDPDILNKANKEINVLQGLLSKLEVKL